MVLSVDICMRRRDADLVDDAKARFWTDRIKAGQVIGAGGAPRVRPTLPQDSKKGGPPQSEAKVIFVDCLLCFHGAGNKLQLALRL